MHFVGDCPPKGVLHVEHFSQIETFSARGTTEIWVKVSHLSTDVVLKLEKNKK